MEWMERHLLLIIAVVWIAGVVWLRKRLVIGLPGDPDDEGFTLAPTGGVRNRSAPETSGRG